jgi:hypothetical protein
VTKTESIVIGLAAGTLCPLLLFIFCWWTSAALATYLTIPEDWIAGAALTGLAIGIGLDVVYLKKFISRFYQVNVKPLVLVYLFCSAVATAFCMGLPLGNLLLGTVAGMYVGRRAYHTAQSRGAFSKAAQRVGYFTALVTGVWALPIGILALDEEMVVGFFQSVVGWTPATISGPVGIGLVILFCFVLMTVQYWCALAGARLMFRHEPTPFPIQKEVDDDESRP